MVYIIAGFFTEGTTDTRFLESVIKRTLEDIAFTDCVKQIEIVVYPIEIDKTGLSFEDQVLTASCKGMTDFGTNVICIHTDADNKTNKEVYEYKINPIKDKISKKDDNFYCKKLLAIVPVQETEAWMLADVELLKQEIGTSKSNNELGLNKLPETMAKPKEMIENAIRIAKNDVSKKRRGEINISELYLPIGNGIEINKLDKLQSFQDFKNNIRNLFRELNLIPK